MVTHAITALHVRRWNKNTLPGLMVVFTGILWSSPYQASKAADVGLPDGRLGTGQFNVISKQHLDLRLAAFEMMHEKHKALIRSKAVDDMIKKPSARCVVFRPS